MTPQQRQAIIDSIIQGRGISNAGFEAMGTPLEEQLRYYGSAPEEQSKFDAAVLKLLQVAKEFIAKAKGGS